MKKIIILSAAIVIFGSSCKKCYQCTTTVTYIPSSAGGSGISKSEFCGTKKEKEAHEKAGTTVSTGTSGSVTVTMRTTTKCN